MKNVSDVLVNAGADVNAKTVDEDTILHAICKQKCMKKNLFKLSAKK